MRTTFLGLIMVVLAAAGCSGQEPAAIDPPEQSTTVVDDQDAPPESLPFAEPTPIDEQIRLALTRPDSFLPDEVSMLDQNAVIISDLLYDGLTQADSKTGKLEPALASEWSHDPTFTRWTFTIDSDASIRPSMVVDHFQGLISSPPSGTTAFVLGSITSVTVDDEGDVVFDLTAPNAGFAWMVSGLQFSVVGPSDGLSGRYQIQSDTDDQMVLSPTSDGPRIVVSWAANELEAYDMMTLAQVDAAVVDPASVIDAKRRYGAEFDALATNNFFVLNPRSPLTATTKRRQAFHLAIEQDELLQGAIPESVVSVSSILSSSLSGVDDVECQLVCQFDLVDAASQFDEEVKDATIRVGVVLPDTYGVGDEIAEDLERAGLEVELVNVRPDELAAAVFDGDIEIFSFGWIAGAGSIDAVIPAVLGPSSPVEPLADEAEAIQQLLNRAATTETDSVRWGLLNDAHEQALASGLILPVSNETHRLVRAPQAEGIVVRADGSIDVLD